MKRTIASILALILALALCACGNRTAAPSTAPAAPAVEDAAPAVEDAAPAEDPVEETAPAEEEVSADEALGVKTASTYRNAMLGIQYTAPEGWYILSDEETAQVMGYVADNTPSEALADALRNSGSVCDLYAMAQDGSGETLNIQMEDLGMLYGLTLSEDRYLELAKPQLESALGQMGLENIQIVSETMSFAGADHVSASITGNVGSTYLYERMVLVKAGNYMATITSFSMEDGRADDILSAFSAIG